MAIDNPSYTYCANHPHRRPDRDPIPIGPITRHQWNDGGGTRVIWRHSPDTEEIRLHLLELLDGLFEHTARDRYPIGHSLAEAIISQLGQFKEQRADPRLEWISNNLDGGLSHYARATLDAIGPDMDEVNYPMV